MAPEIRIESPLTNLGAVCVCSLCTKHPFRIPRILWWNTNRHTQHLTLNTCIQFIGSTSDSQKVKVGLSGAWVGLVNCEEYQNCRTEAPLVWLATCLAVSRNRELIVSRGSLIKSDGEHCSLSPDVAGIFELRCLPPDHSLWYFGGLPSSMNITSLA